MIIHFEIWILNRWGDSADSFLIRSSIKSVLFVFSGHGLNCIYTLSNLLWVRSHEQLTFYNYWYPQRNPPFWSSPGWPLAGQVDTMLGNHALDIVFAMFFSFFEEISLWLYWSARTYLQDLFVWAALKCDSDRPLEPKWLSELKSIYVVLYESADLNVW